MNLRHLSRYLLVLPLCLLSCSDDESESSQSGKAVTDYEDYYTGGELGTVFNSSSFAYSQPAPAVEKQGLEQAFKFGEYFFDKSWTQNAEPFKGLGPLYCRASCKHCHIGYGHGSRQKSYNANTYGNGIILMITDQQDQVVTSFGWVAMSEAFPPFKGQFDASKVQIDWREFTY